MAALKEVGVPNLPATMPLSELAERLRQPAQAEEFSALTGRACVVVHVDDEPLPQVQPPACPVVAIAEPSAGAARKRAARDMPALVDVAVATEQDAAVVVDAIVKNPLAAAALVRLLRHNETASVADGLFAESLAYSTLQHGAEFLSWLARRKKRPPRPEPPSDTVLLDRMDARLNITLNRPHKRNAYSTGLRDALCEALALAVEDDSIERVTLRGAGACFCAGGDLDEFGMARDAAVAHASRMTRSAGALIHRLRDRIEARVHGPCIGAGIELPAFAGHVSARQDAFFQLPEVGMGLVPGAGGTVSILPRIGRRRLAYMALTGARIDAATALDWGLVDVVVD